MAFQVRGLQKGELDGFLSCFQAAFGVDEHSLTIVRNSLVNDPYFHPDRVRVGLLDGVIVAEAVALHRAVYVGNQIVIVAGITAVATHPFYQRRGFGTRVIQDLLRLIRQRGYELAMLTTRVPGFFARFGFREVPKVDGFECPASALARLEIEAPCTIEKLDYNRDWPALAAIYHQYSQGRTGMQVRDLRSWETWPRRGTFPYGFSAQLDACGLVGVVNGQRVAYLAAHSPPEQRHLSVTELAHLRRHDQGAVTLLREAAQQFLKSGGGRAILQMGGDAPVLNLLERQRVPVQVEVGPGLMVLVPNGEWIRRAGFRDQDDAIEHLFRSPIPVMWHRDGY
jgi:predicted N-acetyltransferase YhbS